MAKDFVVVFGEQGARIYKGPENILKYHGQPGVLFNPEIPVGVPPHLWQLDGGKIVVGKSPVVLQTKRYSFKFLYWLAVAAVSFLLGRFF